jgi:hypothetical protein
MGNKIYKKTVLKPINIPRDESELLKIFKPEFIIDGSKLYVKTSNYLETLHLNSIKAIKVCRVENYYYCRIENENGRASGVLCCNGGIGFSSKESEIIAHYMKNKICEYFEKYALSN